MKTFLFGPLAVTALLLAGCGSTDPSLTENESGAVDPVDTGSEAMVADAPAGAGANAGWDENGDGLFQRAEYDRFANRGLSGWDANADGRLDTNEFATGWNGLGWNNPTAAYNELDANGDGYVTNDEWFTDADWNNWDANSNGILDANEFYYS